jgi:hypothetical protein
VQAIYNVWWRYTKWGSEVIETTYSNNMPRERRDLTGAIIADKADWTNEEIIVWLDNREKQEQDTFNRLESEFIGNGNRFAESGSRDIWARVEREYAQDAERYIL